MTYQLHEHADAAAAAQAQAEAVAAALQQALAAKGRAVLAVSGGKSPIAFFEALSQIDLDWANVGITLVDFKVEFGRIYENDFSRVILADEISPDSCRLWDTNTGEKLDKDRFRRDLGDVIESYTEVARRLGIMKDMPTVIQGGLH